MISEVQIEKLKKEDLKEAISIYDIEYDVTTNYDKLFLVYDEIYHNPAYHCIVAKLDGKIIGIVTIVTNFSIVEECKPFLTVQNFVIHKDYRRKTIGAQIFEYIFNYAKNNDYDYILLVTESENKIAQSFYKKLGYKEEAGFINLMGRDEW